MAETSPMKMKISQLTSAASTAKGVVNFVLLDISVSRQVDVGSSQADLMLVLDASGSMFGSINGRVPIDEMLQATHEVIDLLRPHDRLGIVAFDHHAWQVCPLTSGEFRQSLKDSLSRIKAEGGGGTTMCPALEMAMHEIHANARDSRAARLVVLTDGCVDDSDRTLNFVKTLERHSIASLGFGQFDFNFMNQVCAPSHGLCEELGSQTPDRVMEVFRDQLQIAQNTVASNLRLRITPADFTSMQRSYLVHPNPTFLG
ncbi:MAG: VWA domain-containing protein, partial [Planctomycetaceae bacterium]|nr:VWA domain-containing protein [Planctomycetaceae bacterium]